MGKHDTDEYSDDPGPRGGMHPAGGDGDLPIAVLPLAPAEVPPAYNDAFYQSAHNQLGQKFKDEHLGRENLALDVAEQSFQGWRCFSTKNMPIWRVIRAIYSGTAIKFQDSTDCSGKPALNVQKVDNLPALQMQFFCHLHTRDLHIFSC